MVGAPHEARFIVDEARRPRAARARPGDGPRARSTTTSSAAARAMAARRAAGEPLQYIFGHWPFRSLDLLVDPRVLIPRPETEQVVEVAFAEARRPAGAGRDRTSSSSSMPGPDRAPSPCRWPPSSGRRVVREVWATDASATAALAVAAANARARRGDVAGGLPPVELVAGSWLEPLPATVARRGLARGVQPAVRERGRMGPTSRPRSGRAAGGARGGPGERRHARAGRRRGRPRPEPRLAAAARRRGRRAGAAPGRGGPWRWPGGSAIRMPRSWPTWRAGRGRCSPGPDRAPR